MNRQAVALGLADGVAILGDPLNEAIDRSPTCSTTSSEELAIALIDLGVSGLGPLLRRGGASWTPPRRPASSGPRQSIATISLDRSVLREEAFMSEPPPRFLSHRQPAAPDTAKGEHRGARRRSDAYLRGRRVR